MPFTFKWDDAARTTLRFVAEGTDWNWTDYHRMARVASFQAMNAAQGVDVIVDLSRSSPLPRGAVAQIRSFTKRLSSRMTGRVIVIGVDADTEQTLTGSHPERRFTRGKGRIYFVDDEPAAQALLSGWRDGA